jgi:hypothetical protein
MRIHSSLIVLHHELMGLERQHKIWEIWEMLEIWKIWSGLGNLVHLGNLGNLVWSGVPMLMTVEIWTGLGFFESDILTQTRDGSE